jgi:hypothetical protein
MGLHQFERRLERLVEGVFARASKSGLEPVELARRLTREMDAERTLGVRGTVTPNHFTYALAPADSKRFATYGDALVHQLEEAAREHARDEGYTFLGPVHVELEEDDNVAAGTFLLGSEIAAGAGGAAVGSLVMEDGRRVEIGKEPLTIGRLPDCDIVLTDGNVSRRHAEVRRREDAIVIVDLGSTNGTRVNGSGVKEQTLADGDQITLGSSKLKFEAS